MHSSLTRRGAASLSTSLLLLMVALLVLAATTATAKTYVATPLSTHVLNITLNAAGWPTDETTLATAVSGLTTVVNTTICGSLPASVSTCNAFMMAVSATSVPVQVAIQASAGTASYSSGNGTYNLFSQWAKGTNLFSLSALAGTLSTPTFSSGNYTVPCRGSQTYAYLPACGRAESPSTVAYVQTTSSSNLQSTFLAYLCPSAATTTCTATVTVTSSTNNYQIVNITGTSRGVEAVLSFVADARASFVGTSATSTALTAAIPGEILGDSTKQLSVTSVELQYRTVRAVLFSTTEKERTYAASASLSLQCQPSYSMWAIALVVIPFLAILVYWYVWYRGRRRAKKHERRRIVEDETRIMQGYTNPTGAETGETAPPPGMDTSAVAPQWVMDENGNYYDANAGAATTAAAAASFNGGSPQPGSGGAEDVAYQTWVDPNTGETYQYVVDNNAAPAAAGAQRQQSAASPAPPAVTASASGNAGVTYQTYVDPNTGETYQYAVDNSTDGAAAAAAAAQESGEAGGDGNVTYQTYVDPNTGETYQYAVDNSANATAATDGTQQTAAAGEEGGNSVSYQTYVDPETGETYQYAVDDANTTAQDEPVAAGAGDAAADGYQTYVDPNTGESYQYATADAAGGDAQQYEYVDPETGETYMYDASTTQSAVPAEAGEGAEAGATAGEGGATNTYVDPETGETYQYAADPNGGEAYEYVDPETGETYQYQDPNAAQ